MPSKPYDATSKELLEMDPAGWAALLGVIRPPNRVRLVDADLSTVTAAADKVIRIEDAPPWLLHVEFQSSRDGSLPLRMLGYNALLQMRHGLPTATAAVLLAPSADASNLTGRWEVAPPFGPAWEFAYTVIRVWQLPAEQLLTGPPAVLPLASVANPGPTDVAGVLQRIGARLHTETDSATEGKLLTAIGFLLQLRYGAMTTEELIRKFPDIREYAAFRTFLEEGRAEGRVMGRVEGRAEGRAEASRQTLLRLGRKKFGPPRANHEATVNAIADPARLEALIEKLLDVTSWDDLLKSE